MKNLDNKVKECLKIFDDIINEIKDIEIVEIDGDKYKYHSHYYDGDFVNISFKGDDSIISEVIYDYMHGNIIGNDFIELKKESEENLNYIISIFRKLSKIADSDSK